MAGDSEMVIMVVVDGFHKVPVTQKMFPVGEVIMIEKYGPELEISDSDWTKRVHCTDKKIPSMEFSLKRLIHHEFLMMLCVLQHV